MSKEQEKENMFCIKCGGKTAPFKRIELNSEVTRKWENIISNRKHWIHDFYLRNFTKSITYCPTCDCYYEVYNEHPLTATIKVEWNNGKRKYTNAKELILKQI